MALYWISVGIKIGGPEYLLWLKKITTMVEPFAKPSGAAIAIEAKPSCDVLGTTSASPKKFACEHFPGKMGCPRNSVHSDFYSCRLFAWEYSCHLGLRRVLRGGFLLAYTLLQCVTSRREEITEEMNKLWDYFIGCYLTLLCHPRRVCVSADSGALGTEYTYSIQVSRQLLPTWARGK